MPGRWAMSPKFRWFSLALLAVVVAAVAPAQAARPEKERVPFSGDAPFFSCPDQGFDIRVRFSGTDMVTRYYDSAGTLIRVHIHSHGSGTLYNTSDPSKTETGSSPTNLTWDLRKMTFTVAGMTFHNNIPGEGRVAHDTGVLQWELLSYDPETGDFETGELLKSGGKHPAFDEIDWCSMVD
jgi:hypothetical protein